MYFRICLFSSCCVGLPVFSLVAFWFVCVSGYWFICLCAYLLVCCGVGLFVVVCWFGLLVLMIRCFVDSLFICLRVQCLFGVCVFGLFVFVYLFKRVCVCSFVYVYIVFGFVRVWFMC